ncbi:hypothetical protein MHU86_25293 [Fragilaria crotonensis]|nr:hypothetical protein MHU86_25293 [Fragilaria crotonensis]
MNAKRFRTLVVVAFLAVASGQGCSVCGDGKTVSAPTAIFSYPAYDPAVCGELQTAGQQGRVQASNCAFLASLESFQTTCTCVPGTLPPISAPSPTDPPVAQTTQAPTLTGTTVVVGKMMMKKKKPKIAKKEKLVKNGNN